MASVKHYVACGITGYTLHIASTAVLKLFFHERLEQLCREPRRLDIRELRWANFEEGALP